MSQTCIRSGQSIVNLIDNMAYELQFRSRTETFPGDLLCSGIKSKQSGANYITIYAECTSNMTKLWNSVTFARSDGVLFFGVSFPGINVQQGWKLYAAVTFRWV